MVVHSGIAQQSTAQHRTAQHSIVLHCTVQNSTAQYDDCIISVFLDTSSGECMQLALLQSARRKAGGGGFPRGFVLPEASCATERTLRARRKEALALVMSMCSFLQLGRLAHAPVVCWGGGGVSNRGRGC